MTQKIYRILLPEVILNGSAKWRGEGICGKTIDQQFNPYPIPSRAQAAPIKMIHRHGGSFISTMTDTNRWVKMYQSPQPGVRGHAGLPLADRDQVRRHHPAGFHQLRACGHLRMGQRGWLRQRQLRANHRVIIYQHKCIEPLWESKPD